MYSPFQAGGWAAPSCGRPHLGQAGCHDGVRISHRGQQNRIADLDQLAAPVRKRARGRDNSKSLVRYRVHYSESHRDICGSNVARFLTGAASFLVISRQTLPQGPLSEKCGVIPSQRMQPGSGGRRVRACVIWQNCCSSRDSGSLTSKHLGRRLVVDGFQRRDRQKKITVGMNQVVTGRKMLQWHPL